MQIVRDQVGQVFTLRVEKCCAEEGLASLLLLELDVELLHIVEYHEYGRCEALLQNLIIDLQACLLLN